jgi:NAD-dependent deacetylase
MFSTFPRFQEAATSKLSNWSHMGQGNTDHPGRISQDDCDVVFPVDARQRFNTVKNWIADAVRVTVLTGAGISTDSGIPDFRGPQGLWTRDPEAEKMATIDNYMSDPQVRKKAWQWKLEQMGAEREPNTGHDALVELELSGKLLALVTQNVDGFHQQAGNSADKVIEIHGTMREAICMACGDKTDIKTTLDRVRAGELDPACPLCEGILKSATISFGQGLVEEDLARAQRAALDCDLLLAIGSTLMVYPIAGMVPTAREAGAIVVIINGEATGMDEIAHAVLRGSISDLLPRLVSVRG